MVSVWRAAASRCRASASCASVCRRGARLRPRSRSDRPRTLIPARSASTSWESPAARPEAPQHLREGSWLRGREERCADLGAQAPSISLVSNVPHAHRRCRNTTAPRAAELQSRGPVLSIHLLGGFRSMSVRGQCAMRIGVCARRRTWSNCSPSRPGAASRQADGGALAEEQSPEAAANNLHKAIYTARRALDRTSSRRLHRPSSTCKQTPWSWIVRSRSGSTWTPSSTPRPPLEVPVLPTPIGPRSRSTRGAAPQDRYEDWAAWPTRDAPGAVPDLAARLAQAHESRGQPELAIEALRRIVAGRTSR